MSRIGKLPIIIPDEVKVSKLENLISVKGKFGELTQSVPDDILNIEIEDSRISVKTKNSLPRKERQFQGLYRTLIQNMIIGVSKRFEKCLEINGVGYRAQVKGKTLILNLGYSHPIEFDIPNEMDIRVEGNTLTVVGPFKQDVGLLAAKIRDKRPPEPYKGKGIKYKNEVILRKAGKSGKK